MSLIQLFPNFIYSLCVFIPYGIPFYAQLLDMGVPHGSRLESHIKFLMNCYWHCKKSCPYSLTISGGKNNHVNKNELSCQCLTYELCWESIHDYFDRQRVSYFARFSKLLNTRLYKLIYKELICKNVKERHCFIQPYKRGI